jgi:hypothetical protein
MEVVTQEYAKTRSQSHPDATLLITGVVNSPAQRLELFEPLERFEPILCLLLKLLPGKIRRRHDAAVD